jgi:NADH-quinone oxidoreductase subunit H
MWIKYTFPRIRIDHMLNLNWKFFTPLALIVLIVTAILDKILPRDNLLIFTLGMLLANLVIIWITLQFLNSRARIERKRVAEPKPIATPQQSQVRPQTPAAAPQPPGGH